MNTRTFVVAALLVLVLGLAGWLLFSPSGAGGARPASNATLESPSAAPDLARDETPGREISRVEQEIFEVRVRVTDARSGRPLGNARVALSLPEAGSGEKELALVTGSGSELRIPGLARGVYTLRVERPGYAAPDPVTVVFPGDSGVVAFALNPAAVIYGTVKAGRGGGQPGGLVRFTHKQGEAVETAEVGDDGTFFSPMLDEGLWIVDWLRTPKAAPEPRITTEIYLAPGRETMVEIFAPREGVADDPAGLRVLGS